MQYTRQEIRNILFPFDAANIYMLVNGWETYFQHKEEAFKKGVDRILGGGSYKTKRALINLVYMLWKSGVLPLDEVVEILWDAQKEG